MQKTFQTCQSCKRNIHKRVHLSRCCWRVLCEECVQNVGHDCQKVQTWVLESNPLEEEVKVCQRCQDRLRVRECKSCRHSFCWECDEVIHAYGKFRYHQRFNLQSEMQSPSSQLHIHMPDEINLSCSHQKHPSSSSFKGKKPNLHRLQQKEQLINIYLESQQQKIAHKWESIKQQLHNRVTQICQQLKQRTSQIEAQLEQRKNAELEQLQKVYCSFRQISIHEKNLKQLLQINEKKHVNQFIQNKLFQLHHELDHYISKEMKKGKQVNYHVGELVWQIEQCVARMNFKHVIMRNTVHKENKSKHYLTETYQTPRTQVKANSTHYFTPKPTSSKNITQMNSSMHNKKSTHQKKNTNDSTNHSGIKVKIRSDAHLQKVVMIEEISSFQLGARKIKRRDKAIKTSRKNV